MEKTRTYIDKGEAPKFFSLAPEIRDRVKPQERPGLLELVRGAALVVPRGNRDALAELVETASQDEEQSLYRVLWIEKGGRPMVCLGFGVVAATDDTYDCFGVAAADEEWARQGLQALARWLGLAGARLMRFEVDAPHAALARSLEPCGYREEGRLDDFYGDGDHQLLMIWRPTQA